MSREIKFRAWNPGAKRMEREFDIDASGWIGRINMLETYESEPTWLLMQFTGLKDKNGIDIYEGDIVKGLNSKVYRFGNVAEIKYESDYAGYVIIGEYNRNQHHENLSCDWAMELDVIGNIHQHPHLLST